MKQKKSFEDMVEEVIPHLEEEMGRPIRKPEVWEMGYGSRGHCKEAYFEGRGKNGIIKYGENAGYETAIDELIHAAFYQKNPEFYNKHEGYEFTSYQHALIKMLNLEDKITKRLGITKNFLKKLSGSIENMFFCLDFLETRKAVKTLKKIGIPPEEMLDKVETYYPIFEKNVKTTSLL